jgi:hypothetical protein
MSFRFSKFFLSAALLFLSACAANVSGIPGNNLDWEVQPKYFCAGDPVEVSWDLSDIPRAPENCDPAGGGYSSIRSCSVSSECTGGLGPGSCIDNYCCTNAAATSRNGCPNGDGCYPNFRVSITADTLDISPPVQNETENIQGSRTVMPTTTTTFETRAGYDNPRTAMVETETAILVTAVPPTSLVADMRFYCDGNMPDWFLFDVARKAPASENVGIAGIRNTSGHIIEVSELDDGPVGITFENGETRSEFNGKLDGKFKVRLSSRDPASLTVPRCDATNIQDPWPDLQIEFLLECRAEG